MSIPGQQIINVGAPNNPDNSDSLFQAFTTINNNFATLFSTSSPITTISAGNGIAVSNSSSTAYQITNTGVTSLIAGQNVTITTLGGSPGSNGALVISSTGTGGNGGGGTVDSVGVTSNTISVLNSPITTTGNIQIDLPVISTVAGSYVNANLTVDQFGRIVGASNGSASGSVTSIAVSGGAGMAVSGSPITTSGTITVTNTGVTSIVAGTGIAINQSNGAVTITNTGGGGGGGGGTVTRVGVLSNSLTVSGSPIISSGNIQIDLPANLSANVLTATTANLSTINANRFTMISGNNSSLTLTSSTGNSSVSAIVSEKSRGNISNPTAAVVNDSLLSISSKAYTTFNTYQNAGGFSVVLTGTAPNGSSTVSSRAVMSSTSNANISYSLSVEETGNTFIPGRAQTQQSSNIAQIPSVFLSRARGTDSTNVSQVQVGDTIGRVMGYGYSGNGTTSVGGVNGYTFAGSTDWTVAGLPASSGSQLPTDYTIKTVSTSNVTLSSVFSNTGNLSIPGTFIGNGLSITGTFSAGNISAGNISATNISGTLTTAVQPDITQVGTLSSLSVTGNISSGNVTTTNITGTLTTGTQTNITSVGTLGSLSVTGNISAGNVTASIFTGDGSALTGVVAVSSGVAGTVTTAAQPNITSVGTLSSLSVTGAVTAGSLAGAAATGSGASGTWSINVSGSSATSGTVTTAAQPNITSVGTLSSLSVTGAVTAGSLAGASATGSGASGTWGISVSGSSVTSGTVTTAAQPNITSVGTLTSLRVSGNANVGGLETTLTATANLTATVTATIPIVVNGVTYKILLST
jgi:hypothetical protein